jgi:hypothetical protein
MGTATRTSDASTANPMSLATNNDIRSRMVAGQKITSADIAAINTAWNNWNLHQHTYYDQVSLFDFGNVNGGSSSQTGTTGEGPTTTLAGPSGLITAARIIDYQNVANGMKNHLHTHFA